MLIDKKNVVQIILNIVYYSHHKILYKLFNIKILGQGQTKDPKQKLNSGSG